MPTPQDYIISFDFTAFTNQFSQLQRSYTEFGSLIQKVSESTGQGLSRLSDQTKGLYSDLSSLRLALDANYGQLSSNMKGTVSYLDELDKKTSSISENMRKMSGVGLGALVGAGAGLPQDKDTAGERLSDIRPDADGDPAVKEALNAAQEASAKADVALSGKGEGKAEDKTKREVSILQKEAAAARSSAASAASQLTGGLFSGGGLIGMAIGFMLLGYQEKNRRRAEMGEMVNVFEGGMDTLGEATTKAAIRDLSNFQEKAQKKYGIGRKEVQAIAKDFRDIGVLSKDMMKNISNSLGEVGEDVVKLTLGIDKMFNMASGTSSKHVTDMMSNYGDSLSDAANQYLRLSGAAQTSGMGVQRFIDAVYSGSQALSQYGIDLTDVSNVMRTIQKQYEEMGIGKQYAGTLASGAVQGISGAIAGMDMGKAALLGQELFPGLNPRDARQKLLEGFQRVKSGNDKGFFIQMIKAMRALIDRESVDRNQRILFAEQWFGIKDNVQAQALVDMDLSKIQDFGSVPKGLKQAFGVEGMQMSELEKMQYDMLQGVAKIGQGILKLLVGILGAVITGFRLVATKIQMIFSSPSERHELEKEIDRVMKLQEASIRSGLNDMLLGTGQTLGAFGDLFNDIGKPVVEALNVGKEAREVQAAKDEAFSDVRKSVLGDALRLAGAGNAANFTDIAVQNVNRAREAEVSSKTSDPVSEGVTDVVKNISAKALGSVKHITQSVTVKPVVIPGKAIKQSLTNQANAASVGYPEGY